MDQLSQREKGERREETNDDEVRGPSLPLCYALGVMVEPKDLLRV